MESLHYGGNAISSSHSGRRNVYVNIGGSEFGVPATDLIWEQLDDQNVVDLFNLGKQEMNYVY